MRKSVAILAALAGSTMSAVAIAGEPVPTVIYSEILSSDTSRVPGTADARFQSFDRPYRSPDGKWWALTADTDLPVAEDEVLIAGQMRTGSLIAREGTAAGWAPGENVGLLDGFLSIDNDGNIGFATNTDGPTASDEYVVRYDALSGTFSSIAQEGTPIPAIPGATHGALLAEPNITMTMAGAAYRTSVVNPPAGFGAQALILGNTVLANLDNVAFAPTGQAGGATETWDVFDLNDFFVSSDASTWMVQGDLNGATTGDDVLAVNNHVVIQEDSILSGFASPVSIITESVMETNGDWFARGSNDDGQDWLIRNGALLAATGDAIPGGLPGETISDTLFSSAFFTMGGNNNGDYFWGATTSNPDVEADAVIVVNGQVLLRQGDGVDLDGNGLLDDGVFLDIFNNDDAFLTDDLKFYFTADLVDAAGSSLGQAFLRIEVPAPGAVALFGLAGLAGLRRRRTT